MSYDLSMRRLNRFHYPNNGSEIFIVDEQLIKKIGTVDFKVGGCVVITDQLDSEWEIGHMIIGVFVPSERFSGALWADLSELIQYQNTHAG